MFDLPETPLDKTALIGACARLPLSIDAARLRTEVEALPESLWETRGGRLGPHDAARAVFLRGYAPAEGRGKPVEDRDSLAHLPYVRELIRERIQAPPMRCLLASLPGGAVIAPHMDQAPYFGQTIRVHIPVVTHPGVWMFCAGRSYHMQPGEIWVLNNSAVHGVWNADPERARIHLICDFLPSGHLLALLAAGERDLGSENADVFRRLFAAPAGVA